MACSKSENTSRECSEQIRILMLILEETKQKFISNTAIEQLIAEYQDKLSREKSLIEAKSIANACVIALESFSHTSNDNPINHLKEKGFFRILYRNPKILGEELASDDILHKLLKAGFVGVVICLLAIAFFSSTAFITLPFWVTAIANGLFVGASVYLGGILYGVVNDIFATHSNLPYFLLGHQPQQKSLLRTNDKTSQGIAWGVAATFPPVGIATAIFVLASGITAFFVPIATFVLPVMFIAMPLIAFAAELYARRKSREYTDSNTPTNINYSLNLYQRRGMDYMCQTEHERAAWLANSDRNMFGFTKVPIIGLIMLIGLITLSCVSKFLPTVLFVSPIVAIAMPAACAALIGISLMAAGIYMYCTRNRQSDDRYRLEFDRKKIEPDLYTEEDKPYIEKLLHQNSNHSQAFFEPAHKSHQGSDKPEDREPAFANAAILSFYSK